MRVHKTKKTLVTPCLRWLLRIFLYGWAAIIILPLLWSLSTSFKGSQEFMLGNVWKWPEIVYVINYIKAWQVADVKLYVFNTLFVSVLSSVLCIIMVSTTSYTVAKYNFRFVQWIGKLYFASMMIQGALLLVPRYFLVRGIGKWVESILHIVTGNEGIIINLTDSHLTLSIVYATASVAGQVFLLTGFIKSINNSFIEAAQMDGAGEIYIFSKVVMPFIRPVIMFTFITQFMGTWNEYLTGLTFLETESKYTLSVGIQKLVNQFRYQSDYGTIFAGLIIAMLPMLILYIVFQNFIQNGTDMSDGIK